MIWMLVALLLPLAVLLWRPHWYATTTGTQSGTNLALYNERCAELATMDLPADEKAALQLELDREFLASAGEAQERVRGGSRSELWTGGMLILALLGTVGLYQLWGAAPELQATALLDKGERVELTAAEREQLLQLMDVAAGRNTDNLEWAYLNARLLNANGDYNKAIQAFEGILAELPADASADKAATLALLAEARFFAADQKADEATYDLLKQSLALNPNSRQTLGLAGVLAFELQKPQEALAHWRQLWQGLPAGSPESMMLAQGIQRAAERMQANGDTVDLSWMERASLTITVDISAEARAAVAADSTVFVLARAVSGPPMPLAVQRLKVADLPRQVQLDSSMAMAQGLSLDNYDEVTVIARVSRTGQPVAASGDWQVLQSPVKTRGTDPFSLLIDAQVP